jgi:hypothetical protein
MNIEERTRLIKAYLDYLETNSPKLEWSFEKLFDLQRNGDWEVLWQVTVEMIQYVPNDNPFLLAKVAAGPLEDLLRAKGDSFFARVESLARQDANFRLALTGVWGLEQDQPNLWKRLLPMLKSVPVPL